MPELKILYLGQDAHFTETPTTSVERLPNSGGQGIPLLPDFGAILRRWSQFTRASNCSSGPLDLVVTESFGGAYFRGPIRRNLKMHYERRVIELLLKIVKAKDAKLVVIDQSDDLTVHPVNQRLLDVCDLYFKRELAIDRWRSLESLHGGASRTATIGYRMIEAHQRLAEKLLPISLGLGNSESGALQLSDKFGVPSAAGKSHDIIYAGDDWCRPLRERIREELREPRDPQFLIHLPEGRMPFAEFAKAIHSSWLCISPPGLGWDCYRHYESALFGAVPVLSRPDITPHCPFVHGLDAIYYEPEEPILDQLKPWLRDKAKLLDMANLARNRVYRCHTCAARSQYIVDSFKSI